MKEITYLPVDTVECDNGNGGCEHNCTNTNGSYLCTCREGYRLATNGEDCEGTCTCTAQFQNCNNVIDIY